MKKTGLVLMLTFATTFAFAQWGFDDLDEEAKPKERVFVGGGLGLSFSSYYTFASVSPLAGYNFTPRLAAGAQFIYRYTNYRNVRPQISTNDFGVSPFVRFLVYKQFFIHGEYEYLNYQFPDRNNPRELRRYDFSSLMAGAGLFQPFGGRAGFYIMALYNFSYETNSPYDTPLVIRGGITARPF